MSEKNSELDEASSAAILRQICRRDYERQSFNIFTERPVEFAFVFRQLARLYPLRILDVGTGVTALPHLMWNCGFLVTAIDNVTDYWPEGMVNRHWHVIDDDITDSKLEERFDFITCVSVLEHIERHDDAVRHMYRLLEPGGHLALSFPYTERRYVHNVYQLEGSAYGQDAPYICQSYSRAQVDGWLEATGFEIVEQEYWRFWDGGFWTVGEQVIPPRPVSADEDHQVSCLLLRRPE